MALTMRYKSFSWPNNPRTYTLSCERRTAVLKAPMGGFFVQDLGRNCNILRGEGEFFGRDAYADYHRLEEVFRDGGPGELIHPQWPGGKACFTGLKLREEPREDYVAYSFEFCEDGDGQADPAEAPEGAGETGKTDRAAQYHTVVNGDTLWGICQSCGLSMEQILQLNPDISNPNLILTGQKVRVA